VVVLAPFRVGALAGQRQRRDQRRKKLRTSCSYCLSRSVFTPRLEKTVTRLRFQVERGRRAKRRYSQACSGAATPPNSARNRPPRARAVARGRFAKPPQHIEIKRGSASAWGALTLPFTNRSSGSNLQPLRSDSASLRPGGWAHDKEHVHEQIRRLPAPASRPCSTGRPAPRPQPNNPLELDEDLFSRTARKSAARTSRGATRCSTPISRSANATPSRSPSTDWSIGEQGAARL